MLSEHEREKVAWLDALSSAPTNSASIEIGVAELRMLVRIAKQHDQQSPIATKYKYEWKEATTPDVGLIQRLQGMATQEGEGA